MGSLTGKVNSIAPKNAIFAGRMKVADGLVYMTSKVPQSVGQSLRLVPPVTGILNWLFSKKKSNEAKTGFDITGEKLRSEMTIAFLTGNSLD